jgi:hypothetical protein
MYCLHKVNGQEFHPLRSKIQLGTGIIASPEYTADLDGMNVISMDFQPAQRELAACALHRSGGWLFCPIFENRPGIRWRIIRTDSARTTSVIDWQPIPGGAERIDDKFLSARLGVFEAEHGKRYRVELYLEKEFPELEHSSPTISVSANPMVWKSWVGWVQLSGMVALSLGIVGLIVLVTGLIQRSPEQTS